MSGGNNKLPLCSCLQWNLHIVNHCVYWFLTVMYHVAPLKKIMICVNEPVLVFSLPRFNLIVLKVFICHCSKLIQYVALKRPTPLFCLSGVCFTVNVLYSGVISTKTSPIDLLVVKICSYLLLSSQHLSIPLRQMWNL